MWKVKSDMIKNCDKNNKKIEIKPPGRFSHLDLRGCKKKSWKVSRMHEFKSRAERKFSISFSRNCIKIAFSVQKFFELNCFAAVFLLFNFPFFAFLFWHEFTKFLYFLCKQKKTKEWVLLLRNFCNNNSMKWFWFFK